MLGKKSSFFFFFCQLVTALRDTYICIYIFFPVHHAQDHSVKHVCVKWNQLSCLPQEYVLSLDSLMIFGGSELGMCVCRWVGGFGSLVTIHTTYGLITRTRV